MTVVRRYRLDAGYSEPQKIMMPGTNARVIHFGKCRGELTLFAEVHEGLPDEPNKFRVLVDNQSIGSGQHLGTTCDQFGAYHLYSVDEGG